MGNIIDKIFHSEEATITTAHVQVVTDISHSYERVLKAISSQKVIFNQTEISDLVYNKPILYLVSLTTDRLEEFMDEIKYKTILEKKSQTKILVLRTGKNPESFERDFPHSSVIAQLIFYEDELIDCGNNKYNLQKLKNFFTDQM